MNNYSIRHATLADLADIRSWLKQEHEEGVEGCFWANISGIEHAQEGGADSIGPST